MKTVKVFQLKICHIAMDLNMTISTNKSVNNIYVDIIHLHLYMYTCVNNFPLAANDKDRG